MQRLALQELHRQKRNAAIFIDLVNRYDVVVFDGRRGLGFAQETFFGAVIRRDIWQHRLQSHDPFELRIFGSKDDAHATRTQPTEYAITAQSSDLVVLFWRRKKGIILRLVWCLRCQQCGIMSFRFTVKRFVQLDRLGASETRLDALNEFGHCCLLIGVDRTTGQNRHGETVASG